MLRTLYLWDPRVKSDFIPTMKWKYNCCYNEKWEIKCNEMYFWVRWEWACAKSEIADGVKVTLFRQWMHSHLRKSGTDGLCCLFAPRLPPPFYHFKAHHPYIPKARKFATRKFCTKRAFLRNQAFRMCATAPIWSSLWRPFYLPLSAPTMCLH